MKKTSIKNKKCRKKVTFNGMKKTAKQAPKKRIKSDQKLKVDMPFQEALKKAFTPKTSQTKK